MAGKVMGTQPTWASHVENEWWAWLWPEPQRAQMSFVLNGGLPTAMAAPQDGQNEQGRMRETSDPNSKFVRSHVICSHSSLSFSLTSLIAICKYVKFISDYWMFVFTTKM